MAATGFPELNVPADPTAYIGRNVALSQALGQQQQLFPLQLQQQQIATKEAQYQWEATQAINQAYQQAYTTNPQTGVPQFDFDKLQQAMAMSGHGSAIPGAMDAFYKWQQNVLGLQETKTKLQTQENNALGQLGYAVSKANNDPNLLLHGLQSVQSMYPQVGPYVQALQQNPSIAPALAEWMMNQSPETVKQRQDDIKAAAEGLKPLAGGLYDVANKKMVDVAGAGMMPLDADTAKAAGVPQLTGFMMPAETIKNMKAAVSEGVAFENFGGYLWKVNKITGAREAMGASPTIVALGALYGTPGAPGGPGGLPAGAVGQIVPQPGAPPSGVQTPMPGVAPQPPPQAQMPVPQAQPSYAPSSQPAPGPVTPFQGNPLANVPLIQRKDASDKALEAGSKYNKEKSANDNMQTFINLARQGNVIAYSYAPATGVLQINSDMGSVRVNTPELHAYGEAGSAWDRVRGWFGKQVSGASIPPNVLNDMSDVHNAIEQNGYNEYSNQLDLVNRTYGSTYQAAPLRTAPGAAPRGGAPGAGAGGEPTAVGPGGHTIVYRNGRWVDPQTNQPVQ